ncbi:polyketide synthase [Penicillium lividum]|nr:polyketide synthase [Penicillium lividum]
MLEITIGRLSSIESRILKTISIGISSSASNPDHEKNDRYNSQRGNILTAAKPSNVNVELVGVGHGNEQSIELRPVLPLAVIESPATATRMGE